MLSHGQRQRLALARALLLQPSLLILDEATNSLDLDNEENILNTVRALGVTTLLISHRPSAIRFADEIYVLKAGTIKAEAAPEKREADPPPAAKDDNGFGGRLSLRTCATDIRC